MIKFTSSHYTYKLGIVKGITMKSMSAIANASDEAVEKSTGKTWGQWLDFLKTHNAKELSHKEMVKLLKVEGKLKSTWWQQMITNTYEKYIGRRKKGEMEGGFQIGVSKTFPVPVEKLWEYLLSDKGLKTWLNASSIAPEKEEFKTNNGITCELRVFKDKSHLRLRWQPENWEKPSTIQVRVSDKSDKSAVTFHQENMPDQKARDDMKRHWKNIVSSIKTDLVK